VISFSFVSLLVVWYVFSALCSLAAFLYTGFTGDVVENGPGTYFVSMLISALLLVGVVVYL